MSDPLPTPSDMDRANHHRAATVPRATSVRGEGALIDAVARGAWVTDFPLPFRWAVGVLAITLLGLAILSDAVKMTHARGQLTETVWNYRYPLQRTTTLRVRSASLPEPMRTHAREAQLQLCARYSRLSSRRHEANKICAAAARERSNPRRVEIRRRQDSRRGWLAAMHC